MSNSAMKTFTRETRNLTDKTSMREMMVNIANFCSDSGFPEQVGIKEIQKIDKQSFIKYFNHMHSFLDQGQYLLAPRFNEDELNRHLKEMGYCGTLTKAALVSIGALHSTGQILALLSWLADFVRTTSCIPEGESSQAYELKLMMNSYNAWCVEAEYDLKAELQNLYMNVHELDESILETLERELEITLEGCRHLETKSSQIEELKNERKRLAKINEEQSSKISQSEQNRKEISQKDKQNLQLISETKEKIAGLQTEIADLGVAAKNCKLSADEARRIRAQIAAIHRDINATTEQRAEVAELFEKRELQLANYSAEDAKQTRKLNVELMDMGVTIGDSPDRMEKLNDFLNRKPKELSDVENSTLARIERKGQVSANISLINLEIKHIEVQKKRLDDNLLAVKAEHEEMEGIYLSELTALQKVKTAPRSDPLSVRKQLDVDTHRGKVKEQKALMRQQEEELEAKMRRYAFELERREQANKEAEDAAMQYYAQCFEGRRETLHLFEKGALGLEHVKELVSAPNF